MLRDLPPFITTVDPGVTKGHGVAHFAARVLFACELTTDPVPPEPARVVVVETPEIAFAGTVEAVIAVARAAERAVREWPLASVRYVSPTGTSAWKAGDKAEHQYHVWGVLTRAEREIVLQFCVAKKLRKFSTLEAIEHTLLARAGAKSKTEFVLGNVLDAIGLGLWSVGRIDKFGRVMIAL